MVWDERPVILVKQVHRETLIFGVKTPQKNKSLANKESFPHLPSPAARGDQNETLVEQPFLVHLVTWPLGT